MNECQNYDESKKNLVSMIKLIYKITDVVHNFHSIY